MKPRMILLFLFGFLIQGIVNAQCNNKLVEVALARSGPDVQFLREFRARLADGSLQNPVPVAKFIVYLKEKATYRFNIAHNQESTGEAILQLFDRNIIIGTTYLHNEVFEYTALHTGEFEVIISFPGGKSGCAVGIMSLVQKSDDEGINVSSKNEEELEILYLGIKNPLDIASDKATSDTIILTIDNGKIIENAQGSYFAEVSTEGLATLTVDVKDKEGKIKETAKKDFLVRRLPLPYASIHGLRGGVISQTLLQLSNALEIDLPMEFEKFGYKIIDFHVRLDNRPDKQILNYGKNFSPTLRLFLADIHDDSKLIIDGIHVSSPQGEIITLEPIGFIVK
jgi:hypothetical protein